jgi:hypothetical protein
LIAFLPAHQGISTVVALFNVKSYLFDRDKWFTFPIRLGQLVLRQRLWKHLLDFVAPVGSDLAEAV